MILKHQVGLIFGKFYPLHCGHLYLIEKAASQVDELHVILGYEENRDKNLFEKSRLPKQPEVSDRYSWLQQTFNKRPNIHIHALDESGIISYPNGWKDWSDRVKAVLKKQNIEPTVIFTSESQDVDNHQFYFNCSVIVIDMNRKFIPISATGIRQNPYKNWSFIAKTAQPFFVKKIAIIGRPQFSALSIQFANIYNTEYVSNGYINYLEQEIADQKQYQHLRESDYIHIARLHAKRIMQASEKANKLLFTSFDFGTLAQYYSKRFHKNNEILERLQKDYPFDLVIFEKDLHFKHSILDNFEAISNQIESLLI